MKYISILTVSVLLLFGCGVTKELKNKNQSLISQVNSLSSNVNTLTLDNESLKKNIQLLESSNKEAKSKLNRCTSELGKISSIYDSYESKIKKMKAELEATFPNNLKDANFAIVEEDGRLIVRLPNGILYRSGSANFNQEGLIVIQKLSKVIKDNQGLNILVEGHTDDLDLRKGSKYADNWDLSITRAVKVIKQLETYGIHPKRLTAAGRSSFAPLDNTVSEEARAKNRRCEIIIRPKIAEVIKAMSEIH